MLHSFHAKIVHLKCCVVSIRQLHFLHISLVTSESLRLYCLLLNTLMVWKYKVITHASASNCISPCSRHASDTKFRLQIRLHELACFEFLCSCYYYWCLTKSAFQQTLLVWSNQGWWDGLGTQHAMGKGKGRPDRPRRNKSIKQFNLKLYKLSLRMQTEVWNEVSRVMHCSVPYKWIIWSVTFSSAI